MTTEKPAEQADRPSRMLTEGIVLAVTTAFAYALAYYYESGYADTFGIPRELISLDVRTILIAATAFVTYIYVAVLMLDVVWSAIPKGGGLLTLEVRFVAILLIVLFLYAFAYGQDSGDVIILIVGSILICLLYYLWVFFTGPRGLSFREKLLLGYKADRKIHKEGLLGPLIDRLGGNSAIVLIGVGVFALFLADAIGHGTASKQNDFFVLEDESNQVILRVYGNSVISAPFDPCTNEILAPLTVQQMSDTSSLKLRRVRLGPLSVKQRTGKRVERSDETHDFGD